MYWASLVAQQQRICLPCRRYRRPGFDPWVWKIPWRRNDNPLQYSCLENSMDRRAWWATIQGVAKSHTWLSEHTHRSQRWMYQSEGKYNRKIKKKKPMKRDHHKRAVIFYSNHREKPYIALCFLVPSTLENNHFYNSQCPWDQHPPAQETEDYSWYWVWRYISLGCSHKVSTG